MPATPHGRRALAMTALAAVTTLVAALGLVPGRAAAASTPKVHNGTLRIVGGPAGDKLALRLAPGSPSTLQVDVGADGTADFSFDRSTFTAIDVDARGGDDELRIDQSGGAFTDEDVTLNGGAGDDTLVGGSGAETLIGGKGDDFVDGNQGADRALLGGGDDTFQWDPGDGSDVVEGQGGSDTLEFNGANIGESIDVSANDGRVRFFRNVANITMDLDGVERVNFRALGGADTVVVDDLAGTDAKLVDVDLNAGGGGGDDGQPDTVTARGTDGPDRIQLTAPGRFPTVSGLAAEVLVEGAQETNDSVGVATLGGDDTITTGREVAGPESVNVDGGDGDDTVRYDGTEVADSISVLRNGTEVSTIAPLAARLDTTAVESLIVAGLGGDDTLAGSNGIATLTALTLDGGDGDDDLRGGDGADTLLGGDGGDHVDGNIGADRALLGDGDDRFQWDPGDGSDVVEGQSGDDALDFNGSNAGEEIAISANGGRARLTRNIAAITMDFDGIEHVNVRALGSTDAITVDSLAGTGVKTVDVDLSAIGGSGDGQPDTVTVNGTTRRDVVDVTRSAAQVIVAGLAAETRITGSEPALDTLRVQTLDGNDDVTVAPDVKDVITPVVELGADE